MVFELPLHDERVKPHQVTTLHLVCALAFIFTGLIIFVYNYTIPMWGLAILIAGIGLLLTVIMRNKWLLKRKNNLAFRIGEFIVAGGITGLSFAEQWKFPMGIFGVLSAAILFAIYWERSVGTVLNIRIDESGFKLPVTARKRFIPWTEIDDVIFKFGTLTVECLDNHFFQWNINTQIDQEIFEAYCIAQVEENKSKRRKDDW
jgi:hypothetical protein